MERSLNMVGIFRLSVTRELVTINTRVAEFVCDQV